MYATASIGAVWSSCGPDFGARGVLDRYSQLAPRLIFCVDGYSYGGKLFDKRAEIRQIIEGLPTLAHVVHLPYLDPEDLTPLTPRSQFWADALAGADPGREAFQFEQVPFAHPLFILFSSGTTGLPKAIIHCHGGITLEQLKLFHFHMDLHARQRMFFFTSTGWMMWNFLASSLLMDVGAGAVRRQSRLAHARPAVEDGRRHRRQSVRRQPYLPGHSREGRHRARRSASGSRSSRPSCWPDRR